MTRRGSGEQSRRGSGTERPAELLLIDGNNLLHRLSGGVDEVAQRNLLSGLRLLAGEAQQVVLVLDGQPAPGSPRNLRVSANLRVRQAGNADRALLELIEQQPLGERYAALLVSDDRALTERARRLGAQTRRLDWLVQRLERPGRGTLGAGAEGSRPRPRAQSESKPQPDEADEAGEERPAWKPGRRATQKKGNPRRSPRKR